MSKYIKLEDIIRAIAEQLCWEARTGYGDKFTTEDWLEEAEDYVSDLPTIEVEEDCISREWLRNMFGLSEKTRKWGGDHSGYNTMMLYEIQDYIEEAPSVVPKERIEE